MKRNSKYSILFSTAMLALASLTACQKSEFADGAGNGSDILKFSVGFAGSGEIALSKGATLTSEDGTVSIPLSCTVTDGFGVNLPNAADTAKTTKGTQINSESEFLDAELTSFTAQGWDSDKNPFVQSTSVKYTDGKWQTSNIYRWRKTETKTFLTYANLPASATVTNYATPSFKQTFAYTVPTDARQQNDIMLGWYEGNGGGTATAAITMVHPLTAVVFKKGDMEGVTAIKSISIEGVYASGTADVTYALSGSDVVPAYNWGSTRTGSQTVTLGPADGATELEVGAGNIIGEPFIILPQSVAANKLKLTVTVVKDGEDAILYLAVPAGTWEEGKTNTYTIGYEVPSYTFTLSGGATSGSQSFTNTTSTASQSITIISTKNAGGADAPVDWFIKSVKVGDAVEETIGGPEFSDKGGISAEVMTAGQIKLTAAKRNLENPYSHDYWVNRNPVRTEKLDWSPEDWSSTKATSSSPLDLSKFDFRTETTDNPMTTANCYIIRHAGTYRIPLVYGNGVVDGCENPDSYAPTMAAGGDAGHFLSPFQNHRGNGITSAFIENNTGCTASDAAIVWQDMAEVITNVQIVSGASAGTAGSYTASNVRYLQFTVDKSTVCQNNAIVAVKDGSGNIMWSWHIWTTNDPALLSGPIRVTNYNDEKYDFFPMYALGWIDPSRYPSRPDVKIVLQQKKSGNEIVLTAKQPVVAGGENRCCTFEFGRKDPMPTKDNLTGFTITKAQTTLSGSILNPGTLFYANDYRQDDWVDGNPYYLNLWTGKKSTYGLVYDGGIEQDDDMIKTIYDPSPAWYKLPAPKAVSGFAKSGGERAVSSYGQINAYGGWAGGWNFYTVKSTAITDSTPTIFFPLTGYRSDSDAKYGARQGYGMYHFAVARNTLYGNLDGIYRFYLESSEIGTDEPCRFVCLAVRPVLEPAAIRSALSPYTGKNL